MSGMVALVPLAEHLAELRTGQSQRFVTFLEQLEAASLFSSSPLGK